MKKLILLLLICNCMFASKINVVRNFFKKTVYSDCAEVIVALSVLETGWYKSKIHNQFHNYFSLKDFNKETQHPKCDNKPIYCMKVYENDLEGLNSIYSYFIRKDYPTDAEGFLKALINKKYAEDPEHNNKVKAVMRSIKRRKL